MADDDSATMDQGGEVSPAREAPPVDGFLELWVRVANQADSGMVSLTLLVGGAVVTGDLISAKVFFQEQAKIMAEPGSDIEAAILEWGSPTDETERQLVLDEPRYIHFRNAQIVQGPQFVPSEPGTLWRGRLDRVDGWLVGKIGISK